MDIKLLQESHFTESQPHRAPHHFIQATTSEGLAQDPYMAASGGIEPTTLRTEGTDPHHSTNHVPELVQTNNL